MMKSHTKIAGVVMLLLTAIACENQDFKNSKPLDDSPIYMAFPGKAGNSHARTSGSNYTVLSAEYLTSGESAEIGRTIFFRDLGNKQLDADFVPGAALDGTDNVSYYIDQNRPSADLPVAVSSAAITRAMNTWNNVTCSDLGMTRSEEHTSELQSRRDLVCRLLLEKKKNELQSHVNLVGGLRVETKKSN